jgi:hypothetical protein
VLWIVLDHSFCKRVEWRVQRQSGKSTSSDHLQLPRESENPYTRHAPIVNSSGTGKSRMVDELATQIITVPMCLREAGTQGFTSRAFF